MKKIDIFGDDRKNLDIKRCRGKIFQAENSYYKGSKFKEVL